MTNNNTLPFREPYVFPPKPKVKTKTKINVKHLFIGLGLHLFVYSFVFSYFIYFKEPKWVCMFVASFFGTATSLAYWMKNGFRETTRELDNSTDNKCFNNSYQ